jgi:hypothetical protein
LNSKKFQQILESTSCEKTVENIWWKVLSKITNSEITAPYNTDGIIKTNNIHCLLEFKYDFDFTKKLDQCKTLTQSIYYLKKFEDAGEEIPKAIFVGDKNECFVIATNDVEEYLKNDDYNWEIAPSQAHVKNPDLLLELIKDEKLNSYVYDINENFNINELINKIIAACEGKTKLIPITSINITNIFDIFVKKVINDKIIKNNTQKLAGLFIECLINAKNVYLHPKKKNLLVTDAYGEVKVKSDNFLSLFNHFKQEYSPKEASFITEQKDRLIEETARRKTGEFFTPAIWVQEAYKEIAKNFGSDWKEKYRVWDCAAGTANLTKDAHFDDLFISTLNEEDINVIKTMGYNRNATIFQHDFLNGSDDELPEELLNSDKELLVLMNPPYGTSDSAASKTTSGKRFSNLKTNMQVLMNDNKMSHASKQAYCQFVFRLTKLKEKFDLNMKICMFTPEGFMTKPSFANFRNLFYDNFEFKSGFIFKASEFADIDMSWPIGFTCWEIK